MRLSTHTTWRLGRSIACAVVAALIVVPLTQARPTGGPALVSEHGAGQNRVFDAAPLNVSVVSEHGLGQNGSGSGSTASSSAAQTPQLASSDRFDWGAAGIGAATILGVMLLVGATAFVVRHNRAGLTT